MLAAAAAAGRRGHGVAELLQDVPVDGCGGRPPGSQHHLRSARKGTRALQVVAGS